MSRPSKIKPPPPARQASGTIPPLLQPDDLAMLAAKAKQRHVAEVDIAAVTSDLNKILDDYALWSRVAAAGAPPSEIRDWCKQVACQAGDLAHALGHDRTDPLGGHYENMLLHLNAAWPYSGSVSGSPDQERHALHKLEGLARLAAPDLYAAAEQKGANERAQEVAWGSIGKRLAATLRLLQLMADRGRDHHAGRVKHGGRERENARRHLFFLLAGQHERLFGRLPRVPSPVRSKAQKARGDLRVTRPSGPAFRWFGALLELIRERAQEVQCSCPASGMALDANRSAALDELAALAIAAEGRSTSSDALAHWIRDGSKAWEQRLPSCPDPIDPDFKPTPLKDLLG